MPRPWETWSSNFPLPLLLMHENLKKSILSVTNSTLDLSLNKSAKNPNPQSDTESSGFACNVCGRIYKLKSSLRNHQKWECGKDPQFKCPHCNYKAKQKMHLARHMERMHKGSSQQMNKSRVNNKEVQTEFLKRKLAPCHFVQL
ncbi:hypothetical protein RI129_008159 [Pyrocoelia pectoralis]|uniref:C2H2-type domain-containing protein n=1 Tax=Pyrocoelia pectoralis TaxID=417401 RepID=A0AAN7ZH46_9COLE